jgi:hypothetical protein
MITETSLESLDPAIDHQKPSAASSKVTERAFVSSMKTIRYRR